MEIKDKYYYIARILKMRDRQKNELHKIGLFYLIMEFVCLEAELTEEEIKELDEYLNKLQRVLEL